MSYKHALGKKTWAPIVVDSNAGITTFSRGRFSASPRYIHLLISKKKYHRKEEIQDRRNDGLILDFFETFDKYRSS